MEKDGTSDAAVALNKSHLEYFYNNAVVSRRSM